MSAMQGISLVIAGSRGVDPTDEQITAQVVLLPLAWSRPLPDDHAEKAQVIAERIALIPTMIREVVCGTAKGADICGQRWAIAMGIPVHYEPITEEDVKRWGKYVGPKMRNRRMAQRADVGIFYWDGLSGGTPDCYMRMGMRGKHVVGVPMARTAKARASRPKRRA